MKSRILPFALIPMLVFVIACSDSDANSPASTVGLQLVRGQVRVDFAGAPRERSAVSQSYAVAPESNAWTAIQEAVGRENITSQDFGGSLGVFITGFYGVAAEGNAFWEFRVNGDSSDVGVSTYKVRDGDVLEFKYSK